MYSTPQTPMTAGLISLAHEAPQASKLPPAAPPEILRKNQRSSDALSPKRLDSWTPVALQLEPKDAAKFSGYPP